MVYLDLDKFVNFTNYQSKEHMAGYCAGFCWADGIEIRSQNPENEGEIIEKSKKRAVIEEIAQTVEGAMIKEGARFSKINEKRIAKNQEPLPYIEYTICFHQQDTGENVKVIVNPTRRAGVRSSQIPEDSYINFRISKRTINMECKTNEYDNEPAFYAIEETKNGINFSKNFDFISDMTK